MHLSDELTGHDRVTTSDSLPPHIKKMYLPETPESRASNFFEELKQLIKSMKSAFKREPTFYKALFTSIKKDFQTLQAAVKVAQLSHEDVPLLLHCRAIVSEASRRKGILFAQFYDWYGLAPKIKSLLNVYLTNDTLEINLFPKDQDDIRRTYLKLVCDYHAVYEKLLVLEQEISSLSPKELLPKVAYYRRLRDTKNQVIQQLTDQKSILEYEKERLKKVGEKQVRATEIYLRQNKKLNDKLAELSEKIEKLLVTNRMLIDRNSFLELKVERLESEQRLNKQNDILCQLPSATTLAASLPKKIVQVSPVEKKEEDIETVIKTFIETSEAVGVGVDVLLKSIIIKIKDIHQMVDENMTVSHLRP